MRQLVVEWWETACNDYQYILVKYLFLYIWINILLSGLNKQLAGDILKYGT